MTETPSKTEFKLSDNRESALFLIIHPFISLFITQSWGDSILIMEKKGKAFGRIYWYHDDNTTVYLDWLNVDPKFRSMGIGTELQKIREEIGRCLGAKFSCLWVEKGTWMHYWYYRSGYMDWKDHKIEQNAIWMRKLL